MHAGERRSSSIVIIKGNCKREKEDNAQEEERGGIDSFLFVYAFAR